MAPRENSKLEALPTEVLQRILSGIRLTEDLSAAVRASPRILACFLGQREKIHVTVIQSTLGRETFMALLGLLHAPDVKNPQYVLQPYGGQFSGPGVPGEFDDWWQRFRMHAKCRFLESFKCEHLTRLKEGRRPGASTLSNTGHQEARQRTATGLVQKPSGHCC